jgi:hypothetical protein
MGPDKYEKQDYFIFICSLKEIEILEIINHYKSK